MSGRLRFTIMHGGHRKSGYSGCPQQAGAGGLIGRGRIAVRDFSGLRLGSYLCAMCRNVKLMRGCVTSGSLGTSCLK